MSGEPHAALLTALQRFRRRLRLRTFLGYVPAAAAIAIAADVWVVALGRGDAVAPLLGGSLLIAIVAAYGGAVLRTPSIPATARIIDRELRLQDRATTALEFVRATDAVSRLVVTDAVCHLGPAAVSSVSLTMTTRNRWLAVSTVTVSALLLVTPWSWTDKSPVDLGPSTTISPLLTSADVAGRSAPTRPTAASRLTVSSGDDPRMTGPSLNPPHAVPLAGDTAVAGRTTDGNALPIDPQASKQDATRALPSPGAARAGSGTRPTAGAAVDSTGDTRARGSAVRSTPYGAPAAGLGATAPSGTETTGGGVGRGALIRGRSGDTPSKRVNTSNRQRAGSVPTSGRTEAATPAERVPYALRSYVRAYFLSIRSISSQ